MYYFYVLYSLKDERLYKGFTADVERRLIQHNTGKTTSTKNRRPFVLLYFEEYPEKLQATQREAWSKSLEGGAALKQLLIDKGLLQANGKLNDAGSGG